MEGGWIRQKELSTTIGIDVGCVLLAILACLPSMTFLAALLFIEISLWLEDRLQAGESSAEYWERMLILRDGVPSCLL